MAFTFSQAALWTDGLSAEWTLGASPFLELDPVLTGGAAFDISTSDNQIDELGSAGNTLELIDPAAAEAAIGDDTGAELQFSFTRDAGTEVEGADLTFTVDVTFYDSGLNPLFAFVAGLSPPYGTGDTIPASGVVQTLNGERQDFMAGVVDSAFFRVTILGSFNVDDPTFRFNIISFVTGGGTPPLFFVDLRGATETP